MGYSSIDCDESESRLEECTIGEVDFDHYCSFVGITQCFGKLQCIISQYI